jgi:hypothetical protein
LSNILVLVIVIAWIRYFSRSIFDSLDELYNKIQLLSKQHNMMGLIHEYRREREESEDEIDMGTEDSFD